MSRTPPLSSRALAAAALLAVSLPAAPVPAATAGQSRPELPRWIAGCWAGERGLERFTERWAAADAATMLGMSYTAKAGTLSAFEFLRVVVRGARLVYVAQPNGSPPTEFVATPEASTPASVVFENLAHDFPKRIGYERLDDAHLTAWIDGGAADRRPRIEFAMTRAACEP